MPTGTDASSNLTPRHIMEMSRSHVSYLIRGGPRRVCHGHGHISNLLPEDISLTLFASIAQWHQWLRYVREHPPSLEEQQQDLIRQAQIKQLARLADERWASKPSFLDKPKSQQSPPPTETSRPSMRQTPESSQNNPGPAPSSSTPQPTTAKPQPAKEDPWAKANSGNPGDTWQPESWTPSSKR